MLDLTSWLVGFLPLACIVVAVAFGIAPKGAHHYSDKLRKDRPRC